MPKRMGFLGIYCLIGQYLPLYISMASSTVICWFGFHMLLKRWCTSSTIHLSLCNLSYVGLSLSCTSIRALATCKYLLINSKRSRAIHCAISGDQKSSSVHDQYNRFDGNLFNPIIKQIPMYALNSSTQSGVHSLPLRMVPYFSSMTSEAYRLLSLTMRLCSFRDHFFWKRPISEGRQPYGCVHPGSSPVNFRGALL
jgi:hypothetical protein